VREIECKFGGSVVHDDTVPNMYLFLFLGGGGVAFQLTHRAKVPVNMCCQNFKHWPEDTKEDLAAGGSTVANHT
jgi:hypothetical protein